jgi:PAS domain S-box-containing protein
MQSEDKAKSKRQLLQDLKTIQDEITASKESLHPSGKKYDGLVEISFEGIIIFDKLTIKFVNLELLEMFGCREKHEMEEHSFLEFVAPDYQDLIKNLDQFKDKIGSSTDNYVFKAICKNGSFFYAEIILAISVFKKEIVLQGNIRDITDLKMAQEALVASEERTKSIISSMDDQIIAINNDGIIIDFYRPPNMLNESFQYETIINRPYADVFPEAVAKLFKNAIKKILKDREVKQFDYPLQINNSDHWFSAKLSLRRDSKKNIEGVTVVVRNISDRKYAEESLKMYNEELEERVAERTIELTTVNKKLREEISIRKETEDRLEKSQRMLDSILRSIPDVVYRIDHEGNVTFINDAVRKYSYEPEDLIGKNVLDLVHPEDREMAQGGVFERRTGKRRSKNLEIRLLKWLDDGKSFESHDMDIHIQPVFLLDAEGLYNSHIPSSDAFIGTQGIARDITERKRFEKELLESEERFKSIVLSAHDLIQSVDADGHFNIVNNIWLETLGYNNDELNDLTIWDIIHPDSIEHCKSLFTKIMQGQSVDNVVTKFRTKNGKTIVVEGNITSHLARDNKYYSQGLFRDISGRIKAAEEKAQLEEQLRQSQKMEGIGRLAGGIAHDFNNLLTAILGNAELALISLDPDDPVADDINEIITTSERAVILISQLLAFSRKQNMKPKVLNLNELINKLEKVLVRMIGEDIVIKVDLQNDLWMVKVDYGQIEQVVVNLVVNARDAMPEGGILSLNTENINMDDIYSECLPSETVKDCVMLTVSDNGSGMSEEVRSRIFEPFYTTKSVEKGTGLGLSTVYGIIKQSGGYIEALSEEGKGSTFKIYLPRIIEQVDDTLKNDDVIEAPGGNETILVVEDEDSVRSLACKILRRQGYKVIEANSGDEAHALCEQMSVPVDLVVTDVIMPNSNGVELIEKLSAMWPEIKVLYMSGYIDSAIVHQSVVQPGVPYLEKPFRSLDLALRVRELLDS